jgi:hypothetical protein
MQDQKPVEPTPRSDKKITFDGEGGFTGDLSSSDSITMNLAKITEWEKTLGFKDGDLGAVCEHLLPEEERNRRQAERKRREEEEAEARRQELARLEQEQYAEKWSVIAGFVFFLLTGLANLLIFNSPLMLVLSVVFSFVLGSLVYSQVVKPKESSSHDTQRW